MSLTVSRCLALPLRLASRDDHLPWASPARWRALFDPAKVKATVHGAPPDFSPGQVPKQAWQFPSWVGPEYNLSDTKWLQPPQLQEALRSYMGNIAFTDNQLGKIMRVLDEIDYTQNSLVLFTGDHGQNLGEHNTYVRNYPSTRLLTPSPGTAR